MNMTAEDRLLAEDPFADHLVNVSRTDLEAEVDLDVDRNARLSLAADSLVVHGVFSLPYTYIPFVLLTRQQTVA